LSETHWGPERRRRGRWGTRILIVGAFLVCVLVVGYVARTGVDWVQERSSTTTLAGDATIEVVIDEGMTTIEMGNLLEEKGVIDSSAAFVDLVKSRGTEDDLQAGTYEFASDEELLKIVDKLEQGAAPTFTVTIPEGLAAGQVAALLTKAGDMKGDTYVQLSNDPSKFVVPKIGGTTPSLKTLEGLLFPSTYFMMDGDGPTELIGAQLVAFQSKTATLSWTKAEALGLTPYEIVIVASLIEKEVSVAEERPMVAAVIYNRLKKDMTLGIDATVRYAVKKWTGALTTEDLESDSPYNTRIVKGLPPTPIANPGIAAIKAALEPADVDFLYYVLKDKQGRHFFTASYDEFLAAKENAPSQ